MSITQNTDQTHEEIFKTWWVSLSIEQGKGAREKIMNLCNWSRQTWHNRLHGHSFLTGAERQVICQVAGNDLFTNNVHTQ